MSLTLLRTVYYLLIFITLFFGLVTSGQADANSKHTRIILGTATKGGGFQLYGEHLAAVINNANSGFQIEAIATRGSKHNLAMLEEAKIDIGLVEGNAARQALEGIGRSPANLKVLYVMYPNPGMFVVRADTPYQHIEDLQGKQIAFGTRASGLRILARDMLDGIGLKPERDFIPIILDKAAEGPRLVLEKQVEALWGAGIGWPGFVKVANGPAGARFIAPSASQIKLILAKHPHLQAMSVPANTYSGQDVEIDSVGLWSLILIRPEIPDETVYLLTRAIHRGETMLADSLKQGGYTKAINTIRYVPRERLHPGAVHYFEDVDVISAIARSAETGNRERQD